MKFHIFLFLLLGICACTRSPIRDFQEAMRIASQVPIPDNGTFSLELLTALNSHIQFLQKTNRFPVLYFGKRVISKKDYILSLQHFLALLNSYDAPEELWTAIQKDFIFYEVYGRKEWGEVFVTSYYEPIIPGTRQKTGEFTQALYALPEDLLEVDLEEFSLARKTIRARILETAGRKFLKPYYSRKEIDEGKALQGKRLEICWVRPLDAFIMQIQGSGVVRYPDKEEVYLNYAGENGHPYTAIGKYLQSIIPLEEMNLHRIEAYLDSIPSHEMRKILNKNESYVFFRKTSERAITYLGSRAFAGRSIATDARFFPKGALGILSFAYPIFNSKDALEAAGWEMRSQLVIDQDVGGAIRGPGRVDLFMGSGKEAKRVAGLIKHPGRLYYIAPKKELLLWLKNKEAEKGEEIPRHSVLEES